MGQSTSPRRRLGDLAADLRPRPERLPYYLTTPTGSASEPAPGWYMVPAGAAVPVYLGANVFAAYAQLLTFDRSPREAAA